MASSSVGIDCEERQQLEKKLRGDGEHFRLELLVLVLWSPPVGVGIGIWNTDEIGRARAAAAAVGERRACGVLNPATGVLIPEPEGSLRVSPRGLGLGLVQLGEAGRCK